MSDSEDEAPAPEPLEVAYCPHCSFPFEYCEFSITWPQCREALIARDESVTEEQLAAMDAMNAECKHKRKGAVADQLTAEDDAGDDGEGSSSSKKKKKKKKKPKATVIVSRLTRSRRKYVTLVTGLDLHQINLKKAAKSFGKKFACGASVVKSTGEIEIQGDVSYEIVEFMLKTFPDNLKKSDIGFGEDRRK